MLKWLVRAGAMAVMLVIAVGVSAFLLLWASLPVDSGERRLDGLRAPVEIARDGRGVATITGTSRVDLARATGYLHAQERFFQMDLLRRDAAGELSELVGEVALDHDRKRRLFRLRARAVRTLQTATVGEQTLLFAYAEGVNEGLAQLMTQPFEYFLLRQEPKPWRAEDSLLVALALYFDLTDETAERALRLAQLQASVPQPLAEFLVPAATPWDAPLQGGPSALPPMPAAEVINLAEWPREWFAGTPAVARTASELGSNNFVVAGSRTANGQALLAGDMHLGLRVPNTWYRLRLRMPVGDGTPALDVTGVTLPGLPMVISGANAHVAWSFTNSYGVWSERIRLQTDASRPARYRSGDGWKDFAAFDETIAVAGGDAVALHVRETEWGPVIPGETAESEHALRWLPLADGALNLALMDVERATDLDTAMSALHAAGLPPQSAVVADADGRIGWTLAGRMPERGGPAPQLPLDWQQPGVWQGWLDPARVPRIVAPEAGFLATANARLLDGEALARLGDGGYAFGARQQRLQALLADAREMTPADVLRIQTDIQNDYLDVWAGILRAALRSPPASAYEWPTAVADLLADWQPRASVDNAGYRLVRRWHSAVVDATLHALTAPTRQVDPDFVLRPFPVAKAAVLELALQQPAHLLDPRHDSWSAFLLATMDDVIGEEAVGAADLAKRTWGRHNRLQMRHPLSSAIPGLSAMLDMPADELPGDSDVVRVQGPRFGASQRMALIPGDAEAGFFHMPGGQSGHPLSPHYRDGHDDWVQANPLPSAPGEAITTLRLRP